MAVQVDQPCSLITPPCSTRQASRFGPALTDRSDHLNHRVPKIVLPRRPAYLNAREMAAGMRRKNAWDLSSPQPSTRDYIWLSWCFRPPRRCQSRRGRHCKVVPTFNSEYRPCKSEMLVLHVRSSWMPYLQWDQPAGSARGGPVSSFRLMGSTLCYKDMTK